MRKVIIILNVLFLSCTLFGLEHEEVRSTQNSLQMALSLDGDGDYAVIPSPIGLNFGDECCFTIEFWFRSNISQPSNLINKWQSLQLGDGWQIDIHKDSYGDPIVGNLYFIIAGKIWSSSTAHQAGIQDSMAYHFAITVDKNNDHRWIYLDGDVISWTWLSWWSRNFDSECSIGIGALPNLENSQFFNGIIDELRIWDVARNKSQILKTMVDTLSPEYYLSADSGLIGYWRFDELQDFGINGDGIDDIQDLSTNDNHFDLVGNATLVNSEVLSITPRNSNRTPINISLNQNYPNPFNPITAIEFTLPHSDFATLKVFNILGEEVATLVSGKLNQGNHTYQFDGQNLASGIYYYQLIAGEYREVKKMVLIK